MTPIQRQRTEKLIGALRSGAYSQCVGKMAEFIPQTKTESYCALGLALKLKEKHTYENCEQWYGISLAITSAMMLMNDTGQSFEEIANFLETKLA
jgi:hypothetical protein